MVDALAAVWIVVLPFWAVGVCSEVWFQTRGRDAKEG